MPPLQDETYYWAWSRQLSWNYFDHPPGIAAVLAVSTELLGDGLVGLRAPSLLAMLAIAVLSDRSARRLLRASEATRGGTGGAGAPILLAGSAMFAVGYLPGTHDSLQGLAAALAAYATIRAFEPVAGPRWPALAAFLWTSSVLVKHSSALLAVGALFGVLSTSEGRRRLGTPAPWLGLALGLLAVGRWLIGEVTLGGGSLAFQASRVFGAHPRGAAALPLVLGSLMSTLGPVTAPALLVSSVRAWSAARDPARIALAGAALALLLGCVVAVWCGAGEANWPTPALIVGLPGVVCFARERPRWGLWLRRLAIGSAVVLAVVLTHAIVPWLPIPEGRDPIHRGRDFDRLSDAVAAAAERHGAKIVATRRYQAASQLRYHLRDRLRVLELGTPGGRRSQYDRWPRPAPEPGETIIAAWTDPGPPGELDLEPVPGAHPIAVGRGRDADHPFEVWWITVWRARAR